MERSARRTDLVLSLTSDEWQRGLELERVLRGTAGYALASRVVSGKPDLPGSSRESVSDNESASIMGRLAEKLQDPVIVSRCGYCMVSFAAAFIVGMGCVIYTGLQLLVVRRKMKRHLRIICMRQWLCLC